uniref:Uncharacterized protein n=1 Tax=Noctiluca scintillans TaxID=2966 RepID=A0A7S1AIL1_NOCSC|mmetsp:Transcript_47869/g.126726  ORF Transcript_47869/g.126726 Transcript_47869/m.126726 type:complete len:221 (+) Transcript_47869:46-708(+)|eukprot:CAMPEP_0194533336 /NCGR_PEP_ID=MMETSP0253-20130528/71178_1 /TAXON_ID=2966 /ORGANISM="Noctiluca scintillans" /LENGTH=220 /DNA_ID=CAMNT_0039378877 /DNA_START=34 /DNA_END=696 /DNA_ORIENTATION=-
MASKRGMPHMSMIPAEINEIRIVRRNWGGLGVPLRAAVVRPSQRGILAEEVVFKPEPSVSLNVARLDPEGGKEQMYHMKQRMVPAVGHLNFCEKDEKDVRQTLAQSCGCDTTTYVPSPDSAPSAGKFLDEGDRLKHHGESPDFGMHQGLPRTQNVCHEGPLVPYVCNFGGIAPVPEEAGRRIVSAFRSGPPDPSNDSDDDSCDDCDIFSLGGISDVEHSI